MLSWAERLDFSRIVGIKRAASGEDEGPARKRGKVNMMFSFFPDEREADVLSRR